MKFQTLRKFQISEKNFEFQFRFFVYFFDQLKDQLMQLPSYEILEQYYKVHI